MQAPTKKVLRFVALAAVLLVPQPEPPTELVTFASFFGWYDLDLATTRALQDEAAIQRRIAACMEAQGFAYVEFIPDVRQVGASMPSPRDFAAQYGFGIVQRPPPLMALDDDPNRRIVDRLPSDERAGYLNALFTRPSHGAYGGGCSGAANEAVRGYRDKLLEPVRSEMGVIQGDVDSDPRVHAARAAWVQCLAEASIPVQSQAELQAFIRREFVEPLRRMSGGSELNDLAARERRVGLLVFDCDQPLVALRQQVSAEYETRYIQDHRAELEEFRDLAYPRG